jgi:cell division protein FtsB
MEGEKKKKGPNAILIMSVIIFVIGFGLGFYIWGYHKQKAQDYREVLQEVSDYLVGLEKKNAQISAKNKSLEDEVSMLTKGGKPAAGQTVDLQAQLASLERENAFLRSTLNQNQALVQENNQLRSKVQALEVQLGAMRSSVNPAPTMPQP